jgi:hypothetical protein
LLIGRLPSRLGPLFLPPGGCRLVGFLPDGGTTVGFDLRQPLANVPGPVVVWACVEGKCVPHVGSPSRWTYFEDMNAALTDPETVDVRVLVKDRGRVVFDQATRLDQFDERQPNGPGCEPTFFNAACPGDARRRPDTADTAAVDAASGEPRAARRVADRLRGGPGAASGAIDILRESFPQPFLG